MNNQVWKGWGKVVKYTTCYKAFGTMCGLAEGKMVACPFANLNVGFPYFILQTKSKNFSVLQ